MYSALQDSLDFSKAVAKVKYIGDDISRQDFEGYIENMKNVTAKIYFILLNKSLQAFSSRKN